MRPFATPVLFVCLWLGVCGCGTSRWALDDPDYAARYAGPYEGDKLPRMAKQVVDARHVAGKAGAYVGGAVQQDPLTAGGEIGVFAYDAPWLSRRVGLALLASEAADDLFTGVNAGLRVQPPARLAPFAGLGVFAGFSRETVDADFDGLDNDGDGFIDEPGEVDRRTDGALASIYPEVGAHFWLTARTRLTASAAYHVTTLGRDHDFWLYGVGLAILSGDGGASE